MRQGRDSDIGGYDWITIALWGILVFCGWMMIFAAGYLDEDSFTSLYDLKKNYGKQLLWITVGMVLVGIIQLVELRIYQTFAPVFYGITILLLIAVLFTTPINGATSWFDIGGFRFQPSEFAKVTTCIMLSAYLAMPTARMQELRTKLIALGIVLLPVLLVLLQGDAGSTLVYFAFFILLFRAGMDAWIYILGLVVAALAISALLYDETWWLINTILLVGNIVLLKSWRKEDLWLGLILIEAILTYLFFDESRYILITGVNGLVLVVLALVNIGDKKWENSFFVSLLVTAAILFSTSVNYIVNNLIGGHRQERIWVWLRPEKCHPLGPLYNVEQSKFAIGSGGWAGKGFLQGERTKLDYVPEQSTDFIFCTVGEEWGFVGTTFIILVFFALILRILFIAQRQRSLFTKYYALGVACILFFHVFINIGMTTGLVPVIGIPLPFISYGGSSLLSFSILMGLLIKLDSNRLFVFR
ncbi:MULTISPECIES: rod shape-determining protein RodA [unclassified Aureispira]|uniref:rod shape-determining protein RodA n=1 Tax=unclassified Aureispira TaxID=2649989 RepID=UPI0006988128|nr:MULTISPECIES: rod shape-determining protein RodA [unclassified Aureispira]WMX15370.1 rod shape-determining protein RodA [Aureispira sp. CCB-E]